MKNKIGIYAIKNGKKKRIADLNETLIHGHTDDNDGGLLSIQPGAHNHRILNDPTNQVHWDFIEGIPPWLGGTGSLEEALANYRVGIIQNSSGWVNNCPAFINRMQFLVHFNHNRSKTGTFTNVIPGNIPFGWRPMERVIAIWAAQGGSGNSDSHNGLVFIEPNGDIFFRNTSGSISPAPSWPSGNAIVSFSAMWITSDPLQNHMINNLHLPSLQLS